MFNKLEPIKIKRNPLEQKIPKVVLMPALGGSALPKHARATQRRTTRSKKLLLHPSHWRRDCVTLFPNALVQHLT